MMIDHFKNKKLLIICIFVLYFAFPLWRVSAQETVNITVNPSIFQHYNFYQILGNYLAANVGTTNIDYNNSELRNISKRIFPQDPRYPPLVRTFWAITDEKVREIIRFCKEVNCDPMFAISDNKDQSNEWIINRVQLVKRECESVFNDKRHCLHWSIGNEPPRQCNATLKVKDELKRIIPLIRQYQPNAVIHALELYYYPVNHAVDTAPCDSVCIDQYGNPIDNGECIIRILNNEDPHLKIDVFQTHWYPYNGSEMGDSTLTGFNVLNWEGVNGLMRQKMSYPYYATTGINSFIENYQVTKKATLGMGELSTACNFVVDGTTRNDLKYNNKKWGAAFWYLDELGILAEAGFYYVQKHAYVSTESFGLIDYRNYSRLAPSYAYEFLARYFGNFIVSSRSSQPEILNSHASIDNNNHLKLLLVNKSIGQRITAVININSQIPQRNATVYILKVPNGENFESITTNNVSITTSNVSISQNFSYTVDQYSAVIIDIGNLEENCSFRKVGDLNCDSLINEKDLAIILKYWKEPQTDINRDNITNPEDLSIVFWSWKD